MGQQKVFKTGNSLAVTVSHDFAQSLGVKSGDTVRTENHPETGQIVLNFSGAKQLPLSGNFLKKRWKKKK